jgi:predicted DNA-binding transcriptional regulator YafY
MYANAERLLQVAFMMQAARLGVTLNDIQAQFGIGRRTAERLRDAVLRIFPQAEEVPSQDALKRWRIPAGVLDRLVTFEAHELAELDLAADRLRHEGLDARARTLEALRVKLLSLMSAPASARVGADLEALLEAEGHAMRPGPRPALSDDLLKTLRQALLACEVIRLHYRKRTTRHRTVVDLEPHGILFGHRHYLVAFPAGRAAPFPKLYALANVERVELAGAYFVRHADFNLQTYASRSFGVFQEAKQEVVWEFSPDSAADAQEFNFHPTETKRILPNGSLEVRFVAGGLLEMAWHLFTWGSAVRVTRPTPLRETYNNALRGGRLAIAPPRRPGRTGKPRVD